MLAIEDLAAGETPLTADIVGLIDLDGAGSTDPQACARAAKRLAGAGNVWVGVASGPLGRLAVTIARACTTSVSTGPVGDWGVQVEDTQAAVSVLQPHAGSTPGVVLAQLLRATEHAPKEHALWVESWAYSTLLGGAEFHEWRAARPVADRTPSIDAVRVVREGDVLQVVLDRAARRNALDASARAALAEALDVAVADPMLRVELSGMGPSFCSGGDLDEFGTATDLAMAHRLRLEHGPAPRMAAVGARTTARVHGACVGAGVELAAFAAHLVAAADTTFRLPEVGMGLLPGAGGTVSVPARIGRWRTAWWLLSDAVVDLETATTWGLIDEVVDG